MDNTDKNLQATADPAQAEENTAAAELGKFKDVRALLEAYNSLEAEFTRRSQRLKELENAIKESAPPARAENGSAPSQGLENTGVSLLEAARSSDEVRNAIISDYLANASKGRGVPIITGGLNISAQRRVPSSIKEAGKLAEQFFNKREN